MKYRWQLFFLFFSLLVIFFGQSDPLFADEPVDRKEDYNRLLNDLLIVDFWNRVHQDQLPVTYSFLLEGGYFNMPSARMGREGEMGAGFSYVPPYRIYSLRFQMADRLEISGNYRIFEGIFDPLFGSLGFGEYSDKGANFKISLFSPEDSQYQLPGIAIGCQDFMGTCNFSAQYVVLTQVFLNYDMEISLGYGQKRINGLFGGMTWLPFRRSCHEYLQNLAVTLEYDAIPYHNWEVEKHPKGRNQKTHLNFGLKYRIWDSVDLSLSYIRGEALAFSVSTSYNFGYSQGIIPKISDPLPYRAPLNLEDIGCVRPEDVMLQDFNYAFTEQGFELMEAWIGYDSQCRHVLRLRVINGVYREEHLVRERLNAILAALTPGNIDCVIVAIEASEVEIQEYHYEKIYLEAYREQQIGRYELMAVSPLGEATPPNLYESKLIFKRQRPIWSLDIFPKNQTLFGSAKGKFKYAFGVSFLLEGYLPGDIFYNVNLGWFFLSNISRMGDVDMLNPSQIINVRSDSVRYFRRNRITIDQAYLQKTGKFCPNCYWRLSTGVFEFEYGGVAGELLYYPVLSPWAVGVEGALLRKRIPGGGLGFEDQVRKLHGFHATYRKFLGSQYFLNLYYDWYLTCLQFKASIGKFLANDYGARFEVSRYFPSGCRMTFWYTFTNGHDIINGHTYYDKGVYFSMPLDIFYTHSSRARWGYGMSAWLRDVGVRIFTGSELYNMINEQRQY